MNALAVPQVNIKGEAKAIGLVTTIAVVLVVAILSAGFVTPAAVVAGLGFIAVLERFQRLFRFFRRQRKFLACLCVVAGGLCAFAGFCWVVYLGTPLHTAGVP